MQRVLLVAEADSVATTPTVLVSSRDPQAYGDRVRASGVVGFPGKDDLDADAPAALVAG